MPFGSKHGSSDDGSVIDNQVESIASEVISPDNNSVHRQIDHTGFEAGSARGVEGVLAGQSHVTGARPAHRGGHVEMPTKRVNGWIATHCAGLFE
jgi:hypothetical protein